MFYLSVTQNLVILNRTLTTINLVPPKIVIGVRLNAFADFVVLGQVTITTCGDGHPDKWKSFTLR